MHSKPGICPDHTVDKSLRVAIIGAGVSGLTAAHYLKKLGYENVVVFESEDRVGGKVYSYPYQGHVYELGAVWVGGEYVVVTELMKEMMDKSRYYSPAEVTDILSMSTGRARTYLRCIFEDHGVFAMGREVLRFAGIAAHFARVETVGFAGIPAQYHMEIERFAEKNKIENLAQLMSSFVTGCGYGYYRDVPMMYLMKLLPMLVKGMVKYVLGSRRAMSSFGVGWQYLFEQMAAQNEVRLSSGVEKIVRSERDNRVEIALTCNGKTETFDRLILSAGLHKMGDVVDLSAKEQALTGPVKDYRYCVTLIKARNLPHSTVADHVVRNTIGHIATIAHFHPETDVYNIYQLADDKLTDTDLTRIMTEDIERVGGRVDEIITRKFWDYFPHVPREDLDGYYERFEALQGKSGTYYIGSLMNFETVETNAKYAKELVLEHF